MRYGLYLADLRPAHNDSRGTLNYAIGLAGALPALLRPAEQLFLLVNPAVRALLPPSLGNQQCVVDTVRSPGGIASRLMLDHVASVEWARRRRITLLHFPKGHLPFFIPSALATVATIHDDIPLLYARNHFGPGGRNSKSRYFARSIAHSVAAANRVLTVSAFSAQRLASLAPADKDKIIVTYEASTLPSVPFVERGHRDPTILILGSRFPHKRTSQAVEWSHRFATSSAGRGLRVVVSGLLDAAGEQVCAQLGTRRIRAVLSGSQLALLLARSRVLVFGSAYEGFGLPPVEAYSLGTPAVFQDVGAMAEVLDGFPGGYGTPSYDLFAEALAGVTALDDETLLDLRVRMRQRFRWSEVARLTLDAYRAAAGELSPLPPRVGVGVGVGDRLVHPRGRFRQGR